MNRPECIGRIEEAIEAGPTAGPWHVRTLDDSIGTIDDYEKPIAQAQDIGYKDRKNGHKERKANTVFIAACNPSALKELLAYVRELEKDAGRYRQALEEIAFIENQMYGPDWEEIDKARDIARAAIASQSKDKQ